jgi:folate/biopterin transporter
MPFLKNKRICRQVNKLTMQTNNKHDNKPISWSKDTGLKLFDIPASPDILSISLVYFIQGLFGICRLALSFYYKDTLHLTPVDLTIISSISSIPWIIKPLYGFITDTFPLFGYKRKSYLALSGLLSSISWASMTYLVILMNNGQIVDINFITYCSVFFVTLSSLGLAFSDVLVDAIVVEKSRELNQAGSLQSICWSSSSLGGMISAFFSGYLLQNYGTSFVFSLTALIPLTIVATSRLIKEDKMITIPSINDNKNVLSELKKSLSNIKDSLSQTSILYPILFLIIWNITPSTGSAMFYYSVNELGFTPDFFGKLGLISSVSSLVGIVIYNKHLKTVPLRTIFKWTCISGTILGMLPLMLITHYNRVIGIPDTWFAVFDNIILSIFGQITTMPILVLAANICPPGVEAMLYATIMSANNLSGSVGNLFGGLLTKMMGITNSDFTNLPLLVIFTNLCGLIPISFLYLIPDKNTKK